MLSSFFSDIKTGIYNFWFFRKVIWNFRWWDYTFNLQLFSKSLEYSAIQTELKGNHTESLEDALNMHRVIALIDRVKTNSFIQEAERQVGYVIDTDWTFEKIPGKTSYKMIRGKNYNFELEEKVFELSAKLERENWELIWKKLNDEMQGWWN